MPDRDIVFISHAAPEDNEFARWLGTRLTGHGYRVWADLFELRGGTPFWASVEKILRERAIKFIIVISESSCQPERRGVLDEIALADTIKKQLKDEEFIIPARIDNVAYSRFPIQIHRLNAIDFSKGWGAKLSDVVETLQASNVPLAATDKTAEFERWRAATIRSTVVAHRGTEPLHSNVLPIFDLPPTINFFEYSGENQAFHDFCEKNDLPIGFHERLLLTFKSQNELDTLIQDPFAIAPRAAVSFGDFLNGTLTDPAGPRRRDARAKASALIREAFETHLSDRGLLRHEISAGTVMFFPHQSSDQNKVFYTTIGGKKRWKQVCGKSDRWNAFWHFGVRAIVKLDEMQIRLKPFIVFTRDGKTPLADPQEMTTLRRRFCRSWFNNVWSPLFQAFFEFFGDSQEQIAIALGENASVIVSGKGLSLDAAMGMPQDLPATDENDEPEELDPREAIAEDEYEDEEEVNL